MMTPPSQTFTEEGRKRLIEGIEREIDRDLYEGACVKVAHRGEVVVDEAIGWADRAANRKQRTDDIFKLLSVTKSFTNVLVFRAIDQGLLSLVTPVVDIIPEFWGPDEWLRRGRGKLNVTHLLTHTSGIPGTTWPIPVEDCWDADAFIEGVCNMQMQIVEPGTRLEYATSINHALLGEMVKRTDPQGRRYGQILKEEIFDPLGMEDSCLGLDPKIDTDRLVPFTADTSGLLSEEFLLSTTRAIEHEGSEMAFVGAHGTTSDMLLFAEMLRNWGTANGHNFVSPAILDKASMVQTGDLLNGWYQILPRTEDWDMPLANIGLGFGVGGEGVKLSIFGTLRHPRTFGGNGAGTTIWWVDRARELSFVLLTTRAMDETDNYPRFARISDLVLSAVR